MDRRAITSKLRTLRYLLTTHWMRKLLLGAVNLKCRIHTPVRLDGPQNIFLTGKNIVVEHHSWLAAVPLSPSQLCALEIGEGTRIGHFNHIYCTRSIRIGKNVLTADRVYIADNTHDYRDVTTPILKQPVRQLSDVEIGDGAWLGENVCVIGASVGKGSVIGANSVVTSDIPDHCVAVGAPARVVKRYNPVTGAWEKTEA